MQFETFASGHPISCGHFAGDQSLSGRVVRPSSSAGTSGGGTFSAAAGLWGRIWRSSFVTGSLSAMIRRRRINHIYSLSAQSGGWKIQATSAVVPASIRHFTDFTHPTSGYPAPLVQTPSRLSAPASPPPPPPLPSCHQNWVTRHSRHVRPDSDYGIRRARE